MADDTCDRLCLDVPKAQAMRAASPDAEQLSAKAAAFKALGDRHGKMVMHELTEAGRALACAAASEVTS
jgi:hypothetical protein